jgi:hypothetical protein
MIAPSPGRLLLTSVRATPPEGVRVVLCVKFAPGAPFEDVSELKAALIDDPRVSNVMELVGAFDFIVEFECPDGETCQTIVENLAAGHGHLIERFEASFVGRQFSRARDTAPHSLWVRADMGRLRVDHSQIDHVTAEGDYVRIHSHGTSWLFHSTMKKIFEQLRRDGFLRINRSVIVRSDFIRNVVHEAGFWTVLLADGTRHRIARARTGEVLTALRVTRRTKATVHRQFPHSTKSSNSRSKVEGIKCNSQQ